MINNKNYYKNYRDQSTNIHSLNSRLDIFVALIQICNMLWIDSSRSKQEYLAKMYFVTLNLKYLYYIGINYISKKNNVDTEICKKKKMSLFRILSYQ